MILRGGHMRPYLLSNASRTALIPSACGMLVYVGMLVCVKTSLVMKPLLLIWPWDSNYLEQIWSTKHIYDFVTTIHNQYVTDQHLTRLHQ